MQNKSKRNKKNRNYRNKKNKTRKINCGIPSKYNSIFATIDIDAVKNNLDYLKKKSNTEIMPVLKANAYGHGIIPMSKICRKLGVKYIGVATLGEAIYIRNSGDKGRILGWLYDVYSDQVKEAVSKNIDIGLFDENHIPIISKSLPKNAKANIHLFVDTGIDRNGIPYEKAMSAAKEIVTDPKFKLVGLMSHLCCSEFKNNRATIKQLHLFRTLIKKLKDVNITPELIHIGNSNGILNYDMSEFTLSRSGSAFYGLEDDSNLTPVMNITTKIIQLKYISKGDAVGYDRTYISPKKMRIAIVPIGYADFIPLTSSQKMEMMVNGTRRKVLGLDSMDQVVLEAKEDDKLGDEVKVIGNPKNGFIPAYELANKGKTTTFNILTHISNRVSYIPCKGVK
jgi:alanine racemase